MASFNAGAAEVVCLVKSRYLSCNADRVHCCNEVECEREAQSDTIVHSSNSFEEGVVQKEGEYWNEHSMVIWLSTSFLVIILGQDVAPDEVYAIPRITRDEF